jgi:hypothetical protein
LLLFLRLVEEAATLEQGGSLLRGHLDITRREEEHLVRDALHAAVQRIGEPAREIDQALRELVVGTLQVEDHRDPLLELVGDLLRVVEAPRKNEVHAHAVRVRHRLDGRTHLPHAAGTHRRDARRRLVGFRLGPVVEVLVAPARRQAADVRALAVALLQALLGRVPVLVLPVVVLLGDAEVDEGA